MADINLPQSETNDIYSYGFNKSLNRAIPDESTGVVYDGVGDSLNTAQLLSGGSLNLKSLSIGGLVKQVAPGDDIQAAIDAVNREGGGTVQLLAKTYTLTQNINLKSGVALVGAGRENTVLDFRGLSFNISALGNSASNKFNSIEIKNLTIANSTTNGIEFKYISPFLIDNVKVDSCSADGILITACQHFLLRNLIISNNGTNGIEILSDGVTLDNLARYFTIDNIESKDNTSDGIKLSATGLPPGIVTTDFSIRNSRVDNNGIFGIEVAYSSGQGSIIGCFGNNNVNNDFELQGQSLLVTANWVTRDTSVSGGYCYNVSGVYINLYGNGGYNLAVGANGRVINIDDSLRCYIHGNSQVSNQTVDGGVYRDSTVDTIESQYYGNLYENPSYRKATYWQKNTSGATMPVGGVVVYKSVASGDEVTTTTTNGDNKVAGVIIDDSMPNNWYGPILVGGKTTMMLVNNSAASISIGDWLSCYSHAYYAKKAITGDTVFAMALSAPTTSTAQISALIVSPRLI